jgi:hypothetical protein
MPCPDGSPCRHGVYEAYQCRWGCRQAAYTDTATEAAPEPAARVPIVEDYAAIAARMRDEPRVLKWGLHQSGDDNGEG